MWVPKSSSWNSSTTILEKFFIEKIIQRCDYDEAISKKHRTINGFTQLKELIRLAELSKKRIRTLRTLIILIKESKSEFIKQNIVNDEIIANYFIDLKNYILDFNEDNSFKNDSLDNIDSLIHKLKKFEIQLENFYIQNVITEFKSIDFSEKDQLERPVKRITNLVDIILPYLLYIGYSISTINEVIRNWIVTREHINLDKFLDFFNNEEALYELIVFIGNNQNDNKEIKNIIYKKGIGDIEKASKFNNEFSTPKICGPRDELISYQILAKDPVSFIRNEYDNLLKDLVVSKDRKSLNVFTNFFKNSYFRKDKSSHIFFKNIIISGDPISITSRKSTLFLSLINNRDISFSDDSPLDFIKNHQVKKALYYYNLALGSKSIENSLSLMWTSIETILPYRHHKADIENIRELFGKTFSFGALTRDIQYLINRIIVVSTVNNGSFNKLGVKSLPKYCVGEDLTRCIEWLKKDPVIKFNKFNKVSPLLATEYMNTVRPLIDGDLNLIFNRINESKSSIEFQIQRIYLHRNQIVHSGDYINEYTNLWIHLEWYIGKFLYFIILETEINSNFKSMEDLFINLESNFEYAYSYIEKNPTKLCTDSSKVLEMLYEVNWQ